MPVLDNYACTKGGNIPSPNAPVAEGATFYMKRHYSLITTLTKEIRARRRAPLAIPRDAPLVDRELLILKNPILDNYARQIYASQSYAAGASRGKRPANASNGRKP